VVLPGGREAPLEQAQEQLLHQVAGLAHGHQAGRFALEALTEHPGQARDGALVPARCPTG
jgi:hypothetical protein